MKKASRTVKSITIPIFGVFPRTLTDILSQSYKNIRSLLPLWFKASTKNFLRILFYPVTWTNQIVVYYRARKNPQRRSDKVYFSTFKKPVNYENPTDINEKIHWLKFYSDTSNWPELADKFHVREYVKDRGFAHTLNELYAVYESEKDIDISNLPDSFVMKLNNGCADVLIVKDKTEFTNKKIQKYFRKTKEHGVLSGEPHYLKIKRRIVAERLLIDGRSETDFLTDYKFFCFNGEPLYVLVIYNRSSKGHKEAIYTIDWIKRTGIYLETKANDDSINLEKPKSFEEMKEMSRSLANGLPFVRVDWYEIEGKAIFGEMTFTPGAGFINHFNQDFLNEMGQHIVLPMDSAEKGSLSGKSRYR